MKNLNDSVYCPISQFRLPKGDQLRAGFVVFVRVASSSATNAFRAMYKQQQQCIYQATQKRLDYCTSFAVCGASGTSRSNEELTEMIDYLAANPNVGYVVVTSIDRLSRLFIVQQGLAQNFKELGIQVLHIDELPTDLAINPSNTNDNEKA